MRGPVLIKFYELLLADRDERRAQEPAQGQRPWAGPLAGLMPHQRLTLKISPGIDLVTSHVVREVIARGLDSMERDLSAIRAVAVPRAAAASTPFRNRWTGRKRPSTPHRSRNSR